MPAATPEAAPRAMVLPISLHRAASFAPCGKPLRFAQPCSPYCACPIALPTSAKTPPAMAPAATPRQSKLCCKPVATATPWVIVLLMPPCTAPLTNALGRPHACIHRNAWSVQTVQKLQKGHHVRHRFSVKWMPMKARTQWVGTICPTVSHGRSSPGSGRDSSAFFGDIFDIGKALLHIDGVEVIPSLPQLRPRQGILPVE